MTEKKLINEAKTTSTQTSSDTEFDIDAFSLDVELENAELSGKIRTPSAIKLVCQNPKKSYRKKSKPDTE